jgi:uncharacterized protein YciI
MKYFAVTRERGPAWDVSLPMREQKLFADHAAFMNKLADERFIVLGGPIGDDAEGRFSKALFLVKAESEREIETRLDADPYTTMDMLRISKIEPWHILLGNQMLNFEASPEYADKS